MSESTMWPCSSTSSTWVDMGLAPVVSDASQKRHPGRFCEASLNGSRGWGRVDRAVAAILPPGGPVGKGAGAVDGRQVRLRRLRHRAVLDRPHRLLDRVL